MEKSLYRICSPLLDLNRFVLLLLISFPVCFGFYAVSSIGYLFDKPILASIGGMFLLAWIFAIGYKANAKLITQGISLDASSYFNASIIAVLVTYTLTFFGTNHLTTLSSGIQIHYVSPLYIPILFGFAYLSVIWIAAKSLVSAEINREAEFAEYFSTMLLFLISLIGLWFIQPRIHKL